MNLKIAPILGCGLARPPAPSIRPYLFHSHQVLGLPRRWRRVDTVRKGRGADGHHHQLPRFHFVGMA